jgi:hypothetical protein
MKIRTCLLSIGLLVCALLPSFLRAQEVPAGSILEARLQTPVSSYNAKRGDKLTAVLIVPVQLDGRMLLPSRVQVYGNVVRAKRVGVGLVRERARLQLQFNSLQLPGGSTLPIVSQLIEVENAREKIIAGTIIGARATNSYAHRMTGMVTSVASIDPLLTLFAFAGSSSILRFADAEITYPAGTELLIKLSQPLLVDGMAADPIAPIATSELERESLAVYVGDLPVRTQTKNKGIPSDVTNLVFFGSAPQLLEALALAGWRQAAALDSVTKYRTVRAMAENRGYAEAPVSMLLLDGKPPALAFEKNLNTIDKRHHMRVWQIAEGWNGETVWTAAATHDIGIAISKKRPIHKVDPDIDNERSKIVNDLLFTGCVYGLEFVDRARVPRVAYNATGDRLITDGQAAVVRLKECSADHRDGLLPQKQAAHVGNFLVRGARQFDLTMRNSLLRDNIGWQAYRAGVLGWQAAHHHSSPQASNAVADASTETGSLPQESYPTAESEPRLRVVEALSGGVTQEGSLPRLPELALSLEGGKFVGMPLGNVYLNWLDTLTGDVDVVEYPAHIESGALLGGSITLHPSKRLSHQLFWGAAQANLVLGVGPDKEVDRLSIRTVGYQLQANLAPAKWRVRPFVTGGGNLTSYRFKNIKLAKSSGIFRYGLKGLGSGITAYQSAGVAPLDGGKIFRPGFSYGGGMRFRLSRLFELRAEYRESYAKDPDFFNKESSNLAALGLDGTAQDVAARRRGNYIIGLSFTP